MAKPTQQFTLEDWIVTLISADQSERRTIGIKALDAGYALSSVVCLIHGGTYTWVQTVRHVMETEAAYVREHPEDGPNAQLHRIGTLRAGTRQDTPPPLPWEIVHCRSCRTPIIWAVTERHKRIPIDADPDPAGNIMLIAASTTSIEEPPYAVQLRTEADLAGVSPDKLHRTHFATCPNAADWRRSP